VRTVAPPGIGHLLRVTTTRLIGAIAMTGLRTITGAGTPEVITS
jgi:hypothetical protein